MRFVTISKRCRKILWIRVLIWVGPGREFTEVEGADGPHSLLTGRNRVGARQRPGGRPAGADHEAARRLRGQRLVVARGAWLGVVVLTLGLAIPGFVVAFDQPELLHQPELLVVRR
jgi:hypothetical protein